MVPKIDKCISLIGLRQPNLIDATRLYSWVLSNQKEPSGRPGSTNKSEGYVVPFYTPNSISCNEKFTDEYSLIESGDSFDEILGMKLLHGFICAGGWGNNSYTTVRFSETKEWPQDRAGVERKRKLINDSTVGAKFYFEINRTRNCAHTLDYRIVIVAINLRVEEDQLVCLPLQVRTNGHWVGTHGAYCRSDISYRRFTKDFGWGTAWSSDNFEAAQDIEVEKKIHNQILQKLLGAIC